MLAVPGLLAATSAATAATAATTPSLLRPSSLTAKAPATYTVKFTTTKGNFDITVKRSWAPRGADRFYNLVNAHFFDGVEFFRVVKNFVVQFGINGSPKVSSAWQSATIPDDPVKTSNARGTITFADAGPNTRTTQVFVNLADNSSLDGQGFAPFGKVSSGMAVIDKLYGGYGEEPTNTQSQIASEGNAFLKAHFPKLDSVLTARVVAP
jgi:peptidyl-prolyl cis-trans isomerase A (cyclophilin A)